MATGPGASPANPLVDRVKNILMQPKAEWPRIDAEPSTIAGIYRNYVVILAAIPPVAMLIGLMLLGGAFVYLPVSFLVGQAVLSYVLTLAGVYVIALIIDALAPTFGGTRNQISAFKLAAYSMTPFWVAGILFLIPFLGIFALLAAVYGCYLLYLGLPVLMKPPADKVLAYTIVAILASIIVLFVINTVTSRVIYAMMPAPPAATITINAPTS